MIDLRNTTVLVVLVTIFATAGIAQAGTATHKIKVAELGTWTGEVAHNAANGMGRFDYSNGDIYKGTCKNNKRHGTGKYLYKGTSNIFDGKWKDDMRDGIGQLYDPNQKLFVEAQWKAN